MDKQKILVVDDEEQILQFMKEMFEPRGYTVMCVTNGADAFKLAGVDSSIDLMLLDLNLPGSVSGIEVLKVVRERHLNLKVVVLTALDALRDQVRKIGCEAFVSKPFDMEELGQIVKDVLLGKVRQEPKFPFGLIPAARILVVDDEKEIADFIQEDLTSRPDQFDFQVDIAISGEEALEKAKKNHYDVVLTDIKFSRGSMWGGELIERLKALPKPPVGFIIITAVDTEKQMNITKQFPEYPIFDKPMNMDHVRESIRKICFKHELTKKVSAKKVS